MDAKGRLFAQGGVDQGDVSKGFGPSFAFVEQGANKEDRECMWRVHCRG